MYQNPYAVIPGEKLSPQELFIRYLDWSNHSRYLSAIQEKKDSCDEILFRSHLCCEDHFKYEEELNVFYRYFHYHIMLHHDENGFCINTMVRAIHEFDLKIDQITRNKLKRYWGLLSAAFFSALDNS